jgi:hypothetical protein
VKCEIETALTVLVGKPLWSSGRAVDLEWFEFGARKPATDSHGKPTEVGEYALHVQCAWRITHDEQVVVGSRDLFYPPQETEDDVPDFDWEQSPNRRDARVAELFKNETRQFVVQRVEVGDAGAFTLVLNDGYALDVFPHDSLSTEHWRLFQPRVAGPHFVVTGKGLET